MILRGQFADKTFNGSNCNLKSLTELMHLEEIGAATPATAAKLLSEIGKEQSIARRHRQPNWTPFLLDDQRVSQNAEHPHGKN